VYIRRATEHDSRNYREFAQDLVRKNRGREHDYVEFNKANPDSTGFSGKMTNH
jgi:hypothetical protein